VSARLFGVECTEAELRRLVGSEAQVAGVRLVELADGRTRGMRAAEVYTGSGFRFQVLIDRGLDVGPAEDAGRPLAWVHPALGSPALHEPSGIGWLRTFGGGLVTTCGLTHFGAPDDEGPEGFGLHGRASHLPAEDISVRQEWRDGQFALEIEGSTRQGRLFGENLRLRRRISTHLGARSLTIDDHVVNEGFRPAPVAVLYHCNLGFPVVSSPRGRPTPSRSSSTSRSPTRAVGARRPWSTGGWASGPSSGGVPPSSRCWPSGR
jgi:hypothetical protein